VKKKSPPQGESESQGDGAGSPDRMEASDEEEAWTAPFQRRKTCNREEDTVLVKYRMWTACQTGGNQESES